MLTLDKYLTSLERKTGVSGVRMMEVTTGEGGEDRSTSKRKYRPGPACSKLKRLKLPDPGRILLRSSSVRTKRKCTEKAHASIPVKTASPPKLSGPKSAKQQRLSQGAPGPKSVQLQQRPSHHAPDPKSLQQQQQLSHRSVSPKSVRQASPHLDPHQQPQLVQLQQQLSPGPQSVHQFPRPGPKSVKQRASHYSPGPKSVKHQRPSHSGSPGRPKSDKSVQQRPPPPCVTQADPKTESVQRPVLRVPKSYYPIDTKGICILCYRERIVMNAKPVSKKLRQEFSARFCMLLLRHLKMDLQRNIIQPSGTFPKLRKYRKVGVVLCEDCSLLASSFCELYFELENVRLRVDACLQSISDIVKTASRIPSRIKVYQERMGVGGRGAVQLASATGEKQTVGNGEPAKGPVKKAAFVIAKTFRREVLRKTIKNHNSTYPRVMVRRIKKEEHKVVKGALPKLVPISVTIPKEKSQVVFQQLQMFTVAYALSFGLVWSLASLGGNNMVKQRVLPSRMVPDPDKQRPTLVPEMPGPRPTPVSESPNNKETPKVLDDRRNTITITDSGKTVLLPHQTFKIDNTFVDESLMDYEDNCEFVDLSNEGDDLFAAVVVVPNSTSKDSGKQMQPEDPMTPKIEPEPEEAIIDLNDRNCKDCNIYLSCRAELEKHRAFIHKCLCYVQCPVCQLMFTSYQFLKRHRNASEQCAISGVDEIREFETIARPIFPYNNSVRGDKFCPMEGCFEVFLKDDNLKLHLKTHGSFECNFCSDKQFDKAHDLALHETEVHFGSNSSSGYRCSRCNFHVGAQHSFILHFLDAHLKIEVFKERCEICQKGFSSISSVNNKSENKEIHFKTHHDLQGKAPASVFICELCQAPFLKKGQLTEHEVHIHHLATGKKFKCSICGLELVSIVTLEKHKLSVHNNLPVHEMEAEWKRKTQLKQGMKRKNFPCGCGKAFQNNFLLLAHVRKAHNGIQPQLQSKEDQNNEQEKNSDNHHRQEEGAQGGRRESQMSHEYSQGGSEGALCGS